MRTSDLTDTTVEKHKNSGETAGLKFWCSFCNFRGLLLKTLKRKSQPLIKSLSLSLNPASVKLMQHSSLPLPLISCFHKRHVYFWPSLIEVIQPLTCQSRGVLSLSLSSGCDSGSTLIPLPSIPSSTSQPDRGLREYRSRIISALWISGTCCKHYNTLHRQHPRICP